MPACSIKYCGTQKRKDMPRLTLHRFPRNKNLNRKWMEAIGEENINSHHKELWVCSLHFEESMFNRTLNTVRLRDDTVPSIFKMACKTTKKPVSTVKDNSLVENNHTFLQSYHKTSNEQAKPSNILRSILTYKDNSSVEDDHTYTQSYPDTSITKATVRTQACKMALKPIVIDEDNSRVDNYHAYTKSLHDTSTTRAKISKRILKPLLTVRDNSSVEDDHTYSQPYHDTSTMQAMVGMKTSKMTLQPESIVENNSSAEDDHRSQSSHDSSTMPATQTPNSMHLISSVKGDKVDLKGLASKSSDSFNALAQMQQNIIKKLKYKCMEQRKIIKRLNEKVRRRNLKIALLNDVIEELM